MQFLGDRDETAKLVQFHAFLVPAVHCIKNLYNLLVIVEGPVLA
jgi:hypothetical protein